MVEQATNMSADSSRAVGAGPAAAAPRSAAAGSAAVFRMENAVNADSSPPTAGTIPFPTAAEAVQDPLTAVLQAGAQSLLMHAVQAEVQAYLDARQDRVDEDGRRQVVRNGYAEPRTIATGIGPIEITMPRVHDRRPEPDREQFTSTIIPPYIRKAASLDATLPWLYLKGVSTGDFNEALQCLVGPNCPGLSASTISRLVETWQAEQVAWSKRDLSTNNYVYIWADGIYFNVRLQDDRPCMLVLMGATADGRKELIAVQDGYRESEESWASLLLDLKSRGLAMDPKLVIADGALGFWAAASKIWPAARGQRCWVHKTRNVLNKLPKKLQSQAKQMLQDIWMAATKEDAEKAFDRFIKTYQAKYPKAAECLLKDRDVLLTFYDFPAEHWRHIRTTNPIESTFATVRLRHRRTKGNGSRAACLAMVFKLCQAAEKRWRRLNGANLIPAVIANVKFTNGVQAKAA